LLANNITKIYMYLQVYKYLYFLIYTQPLSFSFVRENRPPDANTVYFSDAYHNLIDIDNPILYGNGIKINCPNYKTTSVLADPDEDDMYGNLIYEFSGWKSVSLASCGNTEASVAFDSTDSYDVCRDVTVSITDPGELQDIKYVSDLITCNSATGDKNSCCVDGCWDAFNDVNPHSCGYEHCEWETSETCTYTACSGGCGGATVTETAVTKEIQYQDWCDDGGNCVCSNSVNPRERTFDCPASTSCSACSSGGSGGGESGDDGPPEGGFN